MHYRIIEPKDNLIEKPKEVVHSSMNRFYLKELS